MTTKEFGAILRTLRLESNMQYGIMQYGIIKESNNKRECYKQYHKTMTQEELGAKLRSIREEVGITLYRMIKEGIIKSTTQLRDIEDGRDLKVSTLLRILEAYGKEIKIIDKCAADVAK